MTEGSKPAAIAPIPPPETGAINKSEVKSTTLIDRGKELAGRTKEWLHREWNKLKGKNPQSREVLTDVAHIDEAQTTQSKDYLKKEPIPEINTQLSQAITERMIRGLDYPDGDFGWEQVVGLPIGEWDRQIGDKYIGGRGITVKEGTFYVNLDGNLEFFGKPEYMPEDAITTDRKIKLDSGQLVRCNIGFTWQQDEAPYLKAPVATQVLTLEITDSENKLTPSTKATITHGIETFNKFMAEKVGTEPVVPNNIPGKYTQEDDYPEKYREKNYRDGYAYVQREKTRAHQQIEEFKNLTQEAIEMDGLSRLFGTRIDVAIPPEQELAESVGGFIEVPDLREELKVGKEPPTEIDKLKPGDQVIIGFEDVDFQGNKHPQPVMALTISQPGGNNKYPEAIADNAFKPIAGKEVTIRGTNIHPESTMKFMGSKLVPGGWIQLSYQDENLLAEHERELSETGETGLFLRGAYEQGDYTAEKLEEIYPDPKDRKRALATMIVLGPQIKSVRIIKHEPTQTSEGENRPQPKHS
jgi:hypothetical protein